MPAGHQPTPLRLSASFPFLKGPKTGPPTGPMEAHQNPSLSGSKWLARVICNFPIWQGSAEGGPEL